MSSNSLVARSCQKAIAITSWRKCVDIYIDLFTQKERRPNTFRDRFCLTTKSEFDPIFLPDQLSLQWWVNVSNIPAPIDFSQSGVSGQRRSVYSDRWSWNRSPAVVLWDLGPGSARWTLQKELPRSRCVRSLRAKGRVRSHLPRRKQSCRRMLVNQITKISRWVFVDDSQVKIFPPGVLPLSSQ